MWNTVEKLDCVTYFMKQEMEKKSKTKEIFCKTESDTFLFNVADSTKVTEPGKKKAPLSRK